MSPVHKRENVRAVLQHGGGLHCQLQLSGVSLPQDINEDDAPFWQQACFSPHPVHGQLAAVRVQHVVKPCHQQERFVLNAAPGTANTAMGDNAVMLISA